VKTADPYTAAVTAGGSGRGIERLAVFGGTFDPVHVGHVVVASETRAALGLDRVLLVVAGDPWQKRGQVAASARDRLMLVEAAVEDVDGVEASAIEIERGTPSVTADTLEALAGPHRELFCVLGADAVLNMPTWRRLDETRDLATIVVVERAGDRHAEPPGPGWRVARVPIPRLDVSSTDLRARLAAGRPVDGLVPPAVVRAIRARGLYTDGR
jgi:nicotinate-nucleotide adenylyltransferase